MLHQFFLPCFLQWHREEALGQSKVSTNIGSNLTSEPSELTFWRIFESQKGEVIFLNLEWKGSVPKGGRVVVCVCVCVCVCGGGGGGGGWGEGMGVLKASKICLIQKVHCTV